MAEELTEQQIEEQKRKNRAEVEVWRMENSPLALQRKELEYKNRVVSELEDATRDLKKERLKYKLLRMKLMQEFYEKKNELIDNANETFKNDRERLQQIIKELEGKQKDLIDTQILKNEAIKKYYDTKVIVEFGNKPSHRGNVELPSHSIPSKINLIVNKTEKVGS